jgi:DNA adenine methylase
VLDRVTAEFDKYFEPFLGGAALFFHLISNRKLSFFPYLSDLNKELIITYKIVKDNVSELLQLLKTYEVAYKSAPFRYYYELRDKVKPINDIEKAARFITLNKTCYNGLYRVNRSGIFNVPIGRYKNPLICDSNNLQNVSHALRYSKAIILASDYRRIILDNAQKGDFIYLDPPYNPTNPTSNFTSDTEYGYADNDQEQLASIFKKLDERQWFC